MFYNFVKIHSTLKMSPAMAAGVETRLWEMSDIVKLVEAAEQEQNDAAYGVGANPRRARRQ